MKNIFLVLLFSNSYFSSQYVLTHSLWPLSFKNNLSYMLNHIQNFIDHIYVVLILSKYLHFLACQSDIITIRLAYINITVSVLSKSQWRPSKKEHSHWFVVGFVRGKTRPGIHRFSINLSQTSTAERKLRVSQLMYADSLLLSHPFIDPVWIKYFLCRQSQ